LSENQDEMDFLDEIESNVLDGDEPGAVEGEVIGVDPLLDSPSLPVIVKYQCQRCKAIFNDKKIFVFHMMNMHKGIWSHSNKM